MTPMQEFAYSSGTLTCDTIPLGDIAQRFGTPTYVYSASGIRRRCRDLVRSFGNGAHLVCYAVKANANREILRLVAHEGLGADVGSRGELALALQAGFAPQAITFSGVGKRDDEITSGLEAGIRAFNVESAEEIDVLNDIAQRMGLRAKILLRVNLDMDAGTHRYISTSLRQNKFGVPWQRAFAILDRAQRLPAIEVRGIHSHLGSQITSTEVFLRAAHRMVELTLEMRHQGLAMPDLDFGGGFGVQYRGVLRHEALPEEEPEVTGLSAAAMLDAVLPVLETSGCALAIQPGRSIVAQAGALLVRVLYRKVTEEKIFIVVDGGMNDLLRPSLYGAHHQIVPVVPALAPHETVDVVGPVCESGDFFAQDRLMPRLVRGDLAAVMCTGAYGFVLSSNYNARLRTAEVMVDDGSLRLIRERERLEDL